MAGDIPIEEFLGEAEDIIDSLYRDLLAIHEAFSTRKRVDPSLINNVFRGAHSLKGISGLFGFTELTHISHALETLLDKLRLDKVAKSEDLFDLLFGAVDALRSIVAGKAAGAGGPPPEEVDELIYRLEHAESPAAPDGKDGGMNCVGKEILAVLTEYEEHRLQENLREGMHIIKFRAAFDLSTFDEDLTELQAIAKNHGEIITTLPSAGEAGEDKITFDIIIGAEESAEVLQEAVAGRPITVEVLRPGRVSRPAASPRPAQPAPAKTAPKKPGSAQPKPACAPPPAGGESEKTGTGDGLPEEAEASSIRAISQTVRVDIGKLDNLMNIVGELVIAKNILAQLIDRLRAETGFNELVMELVKNARTMERKLSDLQSGVLEVRMVPVGQIFDKLHRNVRKLGRELDKDVEFRAEGGDTELDKLIIEDLADPLMHLLRNCMDHGIESRAERIQNSKPEKGTIHLQAYQKGNHVVIDIEDDGAGLNFDKIRKKAVVAGLISAESDYREEDLIECLFTPGFSTADKVSEISGRGVGLDVVKSNISSLSGAIDVSSKPGEGAKFSITLPMTLAIIQALIVEAANETFAIPLNSVQQGIIIKPDDIQTIENREVIELRGKTLPLLRLDRLFGLRGNGGGTRPEKQAPVAAAMNGFAEPLHPGEPGDEPEEDLIYVVKVGIADRGLGIIVDKLWGRQDIVIKSVGEILRGVKGIAGATELGNQRTILVLDVVELMEEASVSAVAAG